MAAEKAETKNNTGAEGILPLSPANPDATEQAAMAKLGGASFKLSSFEFKTSEPFDSRDYLKAFPDIDRHLREFSRQLSVEFEVFANSAIGTPLEQNARRLADDFSKNAENILALVIDVAGPKNAAAVHRILENKITPSIIIRNLPPDVAGRCDVTESNFDISISPSARLNSSYESLRGTIIHEFVHGYIETIQPGHFDRNPKLHEGTTEFITSSALGKPAEAYKQETELARMLFQLNERSFMTWYTGGSEDDFRFQLVTDLLKAYPKEKAEEIVTKVIELSRDEEKRTLAYREQQTSVIKPNLPLTEDDPTGTKRIENILSATNKYQALQHYLPGDDDISLVVNITDQLDVMEAMHRHDEESYYQQLTAEIGVAAFGGSSGSTEKMFIATKSPQAE